MKPIDYLTNLVLSVILIIGIYQFYFWCQRNQMARPRELKSPLDDLIPFRPRWVWIYSGLYYPIIVYINFTMQSQLQFIHTAMSYVLLLGLQMAFFVFFPVATPLAWRVANPRGRSERFLAFVQRFDASSNSFPSMHTSVATLTALHLYPHLGPCAFLFPVLIGVSCLFTKQHFVVDLPAGAALGGLVFWVYQRLY